MSEVSNQPCGIRLSVCNGTYSESKFWGFKVIKSLEKCGHCLGISGSHYGYCLCNVRLKLCMLMGLMLCGIIVLSFLMRKLKKTIGKRVIWMNAFVYVISCYVCSHLILVISCFVIVLH